MNFGGFDIGKIIARRWFQVTHGVALIASLALPWAIIDDHSVPVSAFGLFASLWPELDHHAEAGIGLTMLVVIIPVSAIHLYIKLGGGRGLWPAWTLTIARYCCRCWPGTLSPSGGAMPQRCCSALRRRPSGA